MPGFWGDASGRLHTVRGTDNVQSAALGYDGANRPTSPADPGPVTTAMGYRLVTDHLGSVGLVVQVGAGSLTIAQQCEYDLWSKITASQNEGFQRCGFAGGLYDPDTGLVRFGARD